VGPSDGRCAFRLHHEQDDAKWHEAMRRSGYVEVVNVDDLPINVRAWRWAAVIFSAGVWLALLVLAIIIWGPK
jgi:hypothetical protein